MLVSATGTNKAPPGHLAVEPLPPLPGTTSDSSNLLAMSSQPWGLEQSRRMEDDEAGPPPPHRDFESGRGARLGAAGVSPPEARRRVSKSSSGRVSLGGQDFPPSLASRRTSNNNPPISVDEYQPSYGRSSPGARVRYKSIRVV